MKRVTKILAVTILSVATVGAGRVMGDGAAAAPDTAKLSQPAKDIVKMTVSGVPEDVIKSFIGSSPQVYALSSDNIINLQGVGVSASVTTAMLNHDKSIRDNAPVI